MPPTYEGGNVGGNEEQGDAGAETEGSSGTVRDIIERTLLVGMGAATLTKDRLEKITDEFVRRGQLSSEEGRELVEDLTERSRKEARSALGRLDNSLQGTYKDLGLASHKEVEDLDFRVRQLEHRLALAEEELDGLTAGNNDGG